MKVLQLGKFYPIHGGVEKVMYHLAVGFSLQKIHCDMLMASADDETTPIRLNPYCTIYKTKGICKAMATIISPQMITTLRKIQHRYDIIHIHHPDPMAALALRLSGYKGKVVLHWHSDILRQRFALKFYMPLQHWLIDRADIIVCTSPPYAETEHLAHARHKVVILPIGIDKVQPSRRWVDNIQNEYMGRKIIYAMGRLVSYKGFEYLVEAAKYLSDDYVVLIGGRGPLKNTLEQQIVALGLEDKVKLLGLIAEETLASYYEASKLFCLSSVEKTEAFAIVQVEAMSCGRPIVATEIEGSGVPWVNKHGYSGLNVPVRDAKALADAIQAICDDDEIYQEFSQRALQRYEDEFRMETMIEGCKAIYNKL